MNDFERDLATILRSIASHPPAEIDPAEITRTSRRGRARSIAAPLVTVLVIIAVAATTLAISHAGQGRARQSGATAVVQRVGDAPHTSVGPSTLMSNTSASTGTQTTPTRCMPVNTIGDANAYIGLTRDQAIALARDRGETLIIFGGGDTCITRFTQPAVPKPVGVVFDQDPTNEDSIPPLAHIVAARVLDPTKNYIFNQ